MHINNSLSKLSKLELVNTTFQVLAVLEAAAANGFIPHEDTLLTQLRNFTKTFVGYDRRENSLFRRIKSANPTLLFRISSAHAKASACFALKWRAKARRHALRAR